MTRSSIAAVLLLAFVPGLAMADSIQERIEAHRAKEQQIQAALHEKKTQLNAATVRVTNLQGQLQQTNAAISSVGAQLDELGAQEASTQRRIASNTVQLEAAQASLKLHDDALKRRLVDIYENGDLTYLSVLLSASSFSDFVERWQDLRLLIAANQRAVRARRAAEQRVSVVQAELEQTQMALQQQQEAQRQAQSQLDALASERRNLVDLADAQRQHVQAQVAEMEDLSAAEESELEGLIQERQRELEDQRRAAGIATGSAGSDNSGGQFSWPVSGTITSPFGWRRNPFGGAPEFHQGLDIAAPSGTTVTAAASGTIIMAQWYGGYGNYILIDHGGGYSTGYGHLSAMYVSSGQQVARGQAIGAVGSTGESTGPHLHFEVRINGKPVDPAAHLK